MTSELPVLLLSFGGLHFSPMPILVMCGVFFFSRYLQERLKQLHEEVSLLKSNIAKYKVPQSRPVCDSPLSIYASSYFESLLCFKDISWLFYPPKWSSVRPLIGVASITSHKTANSQHLPPSSPPVFASMSIVWTGHPETSKTCVLPPGSLSPVNSGVLSTSSMKCTVVRCYLCHNYPSRKGFQWKKQRCNITTQTLMFEAHCKGRMFEFTSLSFSLIPAPLA